MSTFATEFQASPLAAAPADYLAGYFYGITGFDIRDQLYECFTPSMQLSSNLEQGMRNLINGNEGFAKEKMAKVDQLFDFELESCPTIQKQVNQIREMEKAFENKGNTIASNFRWNQENMNGFL